MIRFYLTFARARKMTYVLIGWCLLILAWATLGATNSIDHTAERCEHARYIGQETCESASHTGTALGMGFVLLIGFMGFVVLSLVWFMTKPSEKRE